MRDWFVSRTAGLATALLLLGAPSSVWGLPTLYAADGSGGTVGNLYTLDPSTGGVLSTVGPIGFCVTGLSFSPITSTMYGVTGGACASPGSLITINLSTGAGALVGSTGFILPDISFDASGTLFGWESFGDDLYTINLGTGAATKVGEAGLGSGSRRGLAFDPSGTLWSAVHGTTGVLRTISPTTGLSTGTLSLSQGVQAKGLASDPSGLLYAVSGATLASIDTSSGLVTTIGTGSATALDALAFVPEPSTALLLGLGLAGLAAMRRRAT